MPDRNGCGLCPTATFVQMRPSTGTIDQKESLSISMTTTPDKIPTEQACPGFAVSARTFMEQCQSLSLQLLDCFAQGLGFPAHFFDPVGPMLHQITLMHQGL